MQLLGNSRPQISCATEHDEFLFFFPSADLGVRFYNGEQAICLADLGFHVLPLHLFDYS